MSGYKVHIIFGFIFSAIIYYFLNNFIILQVFQIFLVLPIIFLYSILPDIDISSSKIRKWTTTLGLIYLIYSIIFKEYLLSISIALILLFFQFVKHRRFFHTISAGLLFSAPLIFFNQYIAFFAFVSYFSHLLIDKKLKFI